MEAWRVQKLAVGKIYSKGALVMNSDIKKILLTKEQIDQRVAEMGRQIAADYAGRDLIVVVLLKGAAWFATDLTRAIDMPLRVDFMVASSYGDGTSTSGSVKVKLDISEDIAGKDVLVIDDIIDSGVTFASISNMLRQQRPASLKTVALCDKAERRINGLDADYVGFQIPDEFVVGYGLDYAGNYRNLPYIGVLKNSVYARS